MACLSQTYYLYMVDILTFQHQQREREGGVKSKKKERSILIILHATMETGFIIFYLAFWYLN